MFYTLNQPLIALYFILLGVGGYVFYSFTYGIGVVFDKKIVSIVCDVVAIVGNVLFFISLSKISNYGKLSAYQFLCFFIGFFICSLILKKPLNKIFIKMSCYLKRYILEQKQKLNNSYKLWQNNLKRRLYERQQIHELRRNRVQLHEKRRRGGTQRKASTRIGTRGVFCKNHRREGNSRNIPQRLLIQRQRRTNKTFIKRQTVPQPIIKTTQRVFGTNKRSGKSSKVAQR